jgi:hypothetical protein
MHYKIIKVFKRLYKTESEIPVATLVVKYITENGYTGRVEMPNRMYSLENVKRAIEKNIKDTMKICEEVK